MILPNIQGAATVTRLQSAGNANVNGEHLDLSPYKGAVSFVRAVGRITTGLGAAHLNVASLEDSADNTNFAAVANFTPVVNAANVSNVGTEVITRDVRSLRRYARVRIEVSGTNANVPVIVDAIGQKERI